MTEFDYDNIGEVVKFNPDDYPRMVAELSTMINGLQHIPIYFKKDIIVSYLKDHAVKSEWIDANPRLVDIMTSGVWPTSNIEKLFEGCRWNKVFRAELERYIKGRLN